MKTIAAIILITLSSVPLKAGALDPSSRVMDCFAQEVKSPQCEVILCEWDNSAANWPKDTGYYRECPKSANETNKMRVIYAGLVVLFSSVFFIKLRRKSATDRADKQKSK